MDTEQPDSTNETTLDFDSQTPPSATTDASREPTRWRSVVAVGLTVVLGEICLYQAYGYTGPAVFFAAAIVVFASFVPRPKFTPGTGVLAGMLLVLSWRLYCSGYAVQVVVGFWLLSAFVMALRGLRPFVLQSIVFTAECVPGGFDFFHNIHLSTQSRLVEPLDDRRNRPVLNLLLPLIAAIVFGGIFVMANPNLVAWFSVRISSFAESVREFLFRFSPQQVVFWGGLAWFAAGLLRPSTASSESTPAERGPTTTDECPIYPAFRNTLLTVIALFCVYLVFEFQTLWRRDFPDGFYYSGYAHQGAAWLTVALALATVMLSLVFRGSMLHDARLPRLKKLAWIWSTLNLLLAIAVYNRLFIYVDFNGMTRMRVVGLLGITSVTGGFALVIWKITTARNFVWLVRHQLWVLAAAVYLYLVLPVDYLIHSWNREQIQSGNHAPVVQITGHDVDDEGLRAVMPLARHEDRLIRRGISALLYQRYHQIADDVQAAEQAGWTARQRSRRQTLEALEATQTDWDRFDSKAESEAAWNALSRHAYDNWW